MDERRREWRALTQAVEAAEREGMLVEFVFTFGERMASGDDVIEAARCALHEWDL